MSRFNTGNALPSISEEDMYDNCLSLDEAMNSTNPTWRDRFNVEKPTIDAALKSAGFMPAGFDFVTGGTLQPGDRNKAVYNPAPNGDNNWYRWNGAFPKEIGANSQPNPKDENNWVPVLINSGVFVKTKTELLNLLSNGLNAHITFELDGTMFDETETTLLLNKLYLVVSSTPITFFVSSISVSTGVIANVGQNQNITITGADVVTTDIENVSAVTGSLGNWNVTFNVANTTGMAVGNVLRVDNIEPGETYVSPASGKREVYPNELAVGAYFMGDATTVTGETTVSVSIGNQNTYLKVGQLVTILGQTRTITSIGSDVSRTFTVDAPWTFGVNGLQWWYYTKPNSGTLSAAGTTINGTGTLFLEEANVGDIVLCDGELRKITAVVSNTQLTVSHAMRLAAGAKYTIITAGLLHEGSFEITAITGKQVTVINRSRYAKPPINSIRGGKVTCIKTVLKNTGSGNGFVFRRGSNLGEFKNIAIQGARNLSSIGLALNGEQSGYSQGTAAVVAGFNTAVIDWGYGAFLTSGCTLEAWKGHFTNNENTGIWCGDGARVYLRESVVSHNAGLGVFVSGGYARVSRARFCGNKDQGIRLDVGAGAYGDSWFTWGNGSHGTMLVNFCGIQQADGYALCNGGDGINFQNAAGGRASRTLSACNAANNLSVVNGKVEATQMWLSGALPPYNGAMVQRGELDLLNSAQTGNGGGGVRGTTGGRVYLGNSLQTKNLGAGLRSENFNTVLDASTGLSVNNDGGDRVTVDGGVVATPEISAGTSKISSHYSIANLSIADGAVAKIYCGSGLVILTFASSSAGISGQVRLRCGSNQASLMTGTGIAVTTGVLTGTTGAPGAFTISAAGDGYCYIENRLGSTRAVTVDFIGNIV